MCGYDTHARQTRDEKRKIRNNIPLTSDKEWVRRAAYDYTGCLAHVDVTYLESTGAIHRAAGYFEHNDACNAATVTRKPPVPLHPHVIQIALEQLQDGARYAYILSNNSILYRFF